MKRIILCLDGTWNSADQASNGDPCPTNVVRTAYRIAKRDARGVPQIVFYNEGVGTGNMLDRYSGGAFGAGLEDNIFEAYRFLIANYEEGDELFLFGFSRGAYTARSLVGMVRNCGILNRECVPEYRAAIALYRDASRGPRHDDAKRFRDSFAVSGDVEIQVHFLGVWDTVGALGIPLQGLRGLTRRKHQFHDTELSGSVKHACHALAIDEHRAPFEPTLWTYEPKEDQRVEQVWFCGAHSDVGGGYPQTDLSDIALKWMLDRAASAGLEMDRGVSAAFPTKPNPLGPVHNSRTGLYRVSRKIERRLGIVEFASREEGKTRLLQRGDPTQSLHPSVYERWDGDASYRPGSLRSYFKLVGDARAA